jgi:hypothetical protein
MPEFFHKIRDLISTNSLRRSIAHFPSFELNRNMNRTSHDRVYSWDQFFRLIAIAYANRITYPPKELIFSLLTLLEDGNIQLIPYKNQLESLQYCYDNKVFLSILRLIPAFVEDKIYSAEFDFYISSLCKDLEKMTLETCQNISLSSSM